MSQQPSYQVPTTPYSYGAYTSTPGNQYTPGTYQQATYATPGAYAAPAGTTWAGYSYGYFPAQAGTSSSAVPSRAAYPASTTVGTPRIATPGVASTPAAPKTTTFQAYTPATATANTYARDGSAVPGGAAAGGGRGKNKSNFKGSFTKELRTLMYGFGDDRNPANDTVNVMEEILIEYIIDVCQTAAGNRKTRLSIEDLRRALSRPADAKKLARMEELLFMQEDIKRARAQYDDPEMEARQMAG